MKKSLMNTLGAIAISAGVAACADGSRLDQITQAGAQQDTPCLQFSAGEVCVAADGGLFFVGPDGGGNPGGTDGGMGDGGIDEDGGQPSTTTDGGQPETGCTGSDCGGWIDGRSDAGTGSCHGGSCGDTSRSDGGRSGSCDR